MTTPAAPLAWTPCRQPGKGTDPPPTPGGAQTTREQGGLDIKLSPRGQAGPGGDTQRDSARSCEVRQVCLLWQPGLGNLEDREGSVYPLPPPLPGTIVVLFGCISFQVFLGVVHLHRGEERPGAPHEGGGRPAPRSWAPHGDAESRLCPCWLQGCTWSLGTDLQARTTVHTCTGVCHPCWQLRASMEGGG